MYGPAGVAVLVELLGWSTDLIIIAHLADGQEGQRVTSLRKCVELKFEGMEVILWFDKIFDSNKLKRARMDFIQLIFVPNFYQFIIHLSFAL